MKYFAHLKDNVVFAYHQSETEVDIPGDNIIEVDENVDSYIGKKYQNGQFIDAPVIKYAILDSENTIISIESTKFSSDAGDNHIITDPSVKVLWKWNGSTFISPNFVEPIDVITVGSTRVTTSEAMPALTTAQIETIESERIAIENLGESSEGPRDEVTE
jgi:hypothetical protein